MKNKRILAIAVCAAAVMCCAQACMNTTKPADDTKTPLTDAALFDIAKQTSGFTWYKRSDELLAKGAKSGHAEPFKRTRYNAQAVTHFDAAGKIKEGTIFSEESTIVKELVNADRSLSGYAVMLKRKADPNADANGWVWGYISASGGVRDAVSRKGAGCIGCHSISGNIDLTLMNVTNP